MEAVLRGNFRHFPAREVFTLLTSFRHTGTLDVDVKGRRTRVFFSAGTIVGAQTTMPSLDPAVVMKRLGATTEQVDAIATSGLAPAVASSAIPSDLLRRYFEEVVLSLFWSGTGAFSFSDVMALPHESLAVSIDYTSLRDEAEQRTTQGQEMLGLYPDDEVMIYAIDDPAASGQITLTADQFRILLRAANGCPLEQLRAESDRPYELYVALKDLENAALLRVESPRRTTIPIEPMQVEEAARPATPQDTEIQPKAPLLIGALTPDKAGDPFPLFDDEQTVGREPTNTIVLPHGSVSSRHARIFRTPEGFVLEDLQSRNGTFVNGERVTEPRLLVKDDLVRFGKVVLTFSLAESMRRISTTQRKKPDTYSG